jgi:preprotein translocase subunit SecA
VGGLHIIGTERHESRRVDNQLRGRSGRQGDPGSSRFYVSLDDDLMRLFAGDRIKAMMDHLGFTQGEVIESPMVTHAIEIAQKRVEGYNFDIRKQLLDYDSTMNKQREVIYNLRRSIIEGEDARELILESILSTVEDAVGRFLKPEAGNKEQDFNGLAEYLQQKFDFDINPLRSQFEGVEIDNVSVLISRALGDRYLEKEQKFGVEQIRRIERMFLLHTIDMKWKEHLYSMDRLKEGMGLRALGQRDPLVEYKREGFHMFQEMFETIHIDVAEMIFKLQPIEESERISRVFGNNQQAVHQEFSGMTGVIQMAAPQGASPEAMAMPERPMPAAHRPSNQPKVGRNDPCPCGSGKKYKKCCGK